MAQEFTQKSLEQLLDILDKVSLKAFRGSNGYFNICNENPPEAGQGECTFFNTYFVTTKRMKAEGIELPASGYEKVFSDNANLLRKRLSGRALYILDLDDDRALMVDPRYDNMPPTLEFKTSDLGVEDRLTGERKGLKDVFSSTSQK